MKNYREKHEKLQGKNVKNYREKHEKLQEKT